MGGLNTRSMLTLSTRSQVYKAGDTVQVFTPSARKFWHAHLVRKLVDNDNAWRVCLPPSTWSDSVLNL